MADTDSDITDIDPVTWVSSCPKGEARTYSEGEHSWSVDRRPVSIRLRAGVSAVQTVCVTSDRPVDVDAPGAETEDAPLVAAFSAIQALAPDSKDSQAFGAFQLAVRDLVAKL